MNDNQKNYLKKLKIRKVTILFTQIFIIVLFLGFWQFLANKNFINTFIFSSPKLIFDTIISLAQNDNLFNHVEITLLETIISFLIGTLLGFFIATILWWNKFIAKVVDPYLIIINSLPKVALGPIIIIWVGANMNSIIVMALLISTIVTIVNIHDGFKNTDETKIKLLKAFGATKQQIFFKLILPNSFNIIISSLKINVSMSLIGVIMGEFLVSKEGIGYLIMYGSQVFNLNLVLSGIILLSIISVILYLFITKIEKSLLK